MTPRRILVAGWLVFLLYAYPGFLATESVNQLMDARVDTYADWYAPSMSVIWHHVGHVVAGPAGMLALQSGLFVAGVYGLLRRGMADRTAAIATALITCFPPAATTMAVIWCDAQLSGFLVAGAAAMLSERRAVRAGGVVLVLVGATMRDAAVIAALPLVLLLFRWDDGDARWRRLGIAAAAWAVVAIGVFVAARALPDMRSDRQQLLRAQHDVIGVIRYADASNATVEKELAAAGLGGVMPPDTRKAVRPLYRRDDAYWEVLPLPANDDASGRAALLRARKDLAMAHPSGYLKHRSVQLRMLLGLVKAPRWQPVYTRFTELPEHRLIARHRATYSWTQSQLIGVAENTPGFLYRPYLYALLALVFLPLAIVRHDRVAGALLASGVLYELALGFLVVAPEYRHSHWMTACTLVAMVMLAAQELRRRRADPRPSPAAATASTAAAA